MDTDIVRDLVDGALDSAEVPRGAADHANHRQHRTPSPAPAISDVGVVPPIVTSSKSIDSQFKRMNRGDDEWSDNIPMSLRHPTPTIRH
jgi:hypothetical protein